MVFNIDKYKLGLTQGQIDALKDVYDQAIADSAVADLAAAAAAAAIADKAAETIVVDSTLTSETDAGGALDDAFGVGRTTESIKGNADDIDALERSGSTIAVGGAVTDASRSVTLTIKDGDGTAVEGYHIVGVKVTDGNGAGADSGVNTPIAGAGLDTVDGLVIGDSGEQISPSNGAAIADTRNASLLAFTSYDGILTVRLNKDSGNDFFFVHFLLPDGSVVSSDEIELNNAG